jgi:hypothetical protein
MSPRLFRQFLKPRMKRLIDLAHSYGVKVMITTTGPSGSSSPT